MEFNLKQFREDEITVIKGNPYPKIAGRLRLSHENNERLSISTEIIRYNDEVAIVKAECTTSKGFFCGIGMASNDRDERIAPAILELAETRAIARSLRFAGYGIEYCSAEEVSHIINGNGGNPFFDNTVKEKEEPDSKDDINNLPKNNNGNNGNGRLSGKQYKYILTLLGKSGKNKKDMDEYCVNTYGSTLQHLSKNNASNLIENLLQQ